MYKYHLLKLFFYNINIFILKYQNKKVNFIKFFLNKYKKKENLIKININEYSKNSFNKILFIKILNLLNIIIQFTIKQIFIFLTRTNQIIIFFLFMNFNNRRNIFFSFIRSLWFRRFMF